MRSLLPNLGRITYLETLFSLRIPAGLVFVFLLPSMMLLLLGSRSEAKDFVVPGLIALVVAFSTMQGVGQVAGSMRHGIWQTFQVALHPGWLYLGGVLISRLIRTVLVSIFLLLLALAAFGWWIRGSLLLHAAAVLAGGVAFASLGLLLAFLPRSPNAASQGINVVTVLLMAVSGTFFAPAGMLGVISLASPLTYLTRLIRANATGVPLTGAQIATDFAVLAAWTLVAGPWAYYLARVREQD